MTTNRPLAALAALLVVLPAVLAAGTPVAASATDAGAPDSFRAASTPGNGTTNASNASVAPGERLAGVVGVQAAEIDAEVEERTFGVRIARAASNGSRAAVVADQLSTIEQRLEELQREKQALQNARENGSVSEGRYRAEVAEMAARAESLRRQANASGSVASGLPEDELAEHGVDVSAIQRLREDAVNLTGPEVAAIARSIAGRDVGRPVSPGPPVAPGGNGTAGAPSADRILTEVEEAERALQTTREQVNRTAPGLGEAPAVEDLLNRTRENLTAAADELEAAREALDRGNATAAEDHLDAARDHLDAAESALQSAEDEAAGAGDGRGG